MITASTIAALFLGGVLAILIPAAAAAAFKLRNRDAWLPSVFIGAGTFFVFAMVFEQLLHLAMLPAVQDNAALTCVYAALAAGVFEETGRFVAYKTLMRKHYSTKNAVYMGIGHGGFEAIMLLGMTFISYGATALSANALGAERFVEMSAAGNAELADTLRQQLDVIRECGFASIVPALYERLIAMTFHVCMSVVVYKAASSERQVWLYPLAVLLHALLDVPAAMYQTGVIASIPAVHAIMTAFVAAVVFGTVMLAKKLPDKAVQ